MPSNALLPLVSFLQEGLRNVDLRSLDLRSLLNRSDLGHWLSQMDVKTVGLVALAVLALLLVLQFFAGTSPFVRGSLLGQPAFARAAQDANTRNPYSRSLDPLMTEVLSALAEAVIRWEAPQDSAVSNRAL